MVVPAAVEDRRSILLNGGFARVETETVCPRFDVVECALRARSATYESTGVATI